MDVDEETSTRRPRRERRNRTSSPSSPSRSSNNDSYSYSSRRSRRTYNDDEDDEDTGRSRRSRRAARDDDEEEEDTRSSRRSRRQQQDDEEEDSSSRRSRRRAAEEEEEEEAPRSTSRSTVSVKTSSRAAVMGATMNGMNEARRKRVQQAIIDGMTKYAEQKFGRKRAAPKASKGRTAMDDYEIYLRSLRSKVKTSQDKLNIVLKQKREVEEKVKKAETEVGKQEKTLKDAEDERKIAEREGRDPKLPSGFVVPQSAKKAVAGAGFANLVMKASAQLWEDKFMAMRAKKGGNEGQPEWMAKSKRSDKILVNVGKKGGHKKDEEHKPAWGSNLKKAEPRRKVEAKHEDTGKQPAFASVSLRKTAKKEEDEDTGTKKVDWKEMEKKTSTSGSSRRRRGGGDDDSD